jgi:hypothetical protein
MFPTYSRHTQLALYGSIVAAMFALNGCGSEASAGPSKGRAASLAPDRPPTKGACDDCQGLWGVHGIGEVETCICRTADAGQACFDGSDCQGQCLVENEAAFQVTREGSPPVGFYAGRCSEYVTTFGCHLMIPNGTDSRLPLASDQAALHVCID